MIDPILAAHGVNRENTTILPLSSPAAAKAFKDGEADVFVLISELSASLVQEFLRDPTVRLMSVTQAEAITRVHPYLTRLVLPQGVIDFERNIPANDVILISDTQAVVVRKTLHPELVYLLAKAMSDEHSAAGILQRAGEFPTATDPEFPISQTASDFYKNGPSFLYKYLPVWIVTYFQRLLALIATAIAIILPLFSYLPKIYLWFVRDYTDRLMCRLRVIETGLQTELDVKQVQAMQSDLENISLAAHLLPMRHTDLFFSLRGHIDRERTRIAAKLAEAQGQTA